MRKTVLTLIVAITAFIALPAQANVLDQTSIESTASVSGAVNFIVETAETISETAETMPAPTLPSATNETPAELPTTQTDTSTITQTNTTDSAQAATELTDQQQVEAIIAAIATDEVHAAALAQISNQAFGHVADINLANGSGIWQNVLRVFSKRQATTSFRELIVAVRVAVTQDSIDSTQANEFIATLEAIIEKL